MSAVLRKLTEHGKHDPAQWERTSTISDDDRVGSRLAMRCETADMRHERLIRSRQGRGTMPARLVTRV
jgi:hypothetical protein